MKENFAIIPSVYHNRRARAQRISRIARALVVVGMLVAGLASMSAAIPGVQTVTTVSARGAGGGGGGGGGGQPPIILPADWPATVPVPAGTLQQTIGASPHWILQLVADGNYPDVVQAIRALYLSHGFTEPNPQSASYVFENDLYRVSVGGAARDHSPTQTIVNVYLDRK